MKRFLVLLFVLCGCLRVAAPVQAESILRFDVRAELSADRTLKITETIEYDFGQAQKHGIYRLIPITYSRYGGAYRLRLKVGESLMNGSPVPQEVTDEGDQLRIRLGDPDSYVSGRRVYVITYSTDRAVNDFLEDGEREIYWNVTGDQWDVPIEEAGFTIAGPVPATRAICFTGPFGSPEQDCTITTSSERVIANVTRPLGLREGFTVAIRYPAESIAPLPWWKIVLDLFFDNLWLFTPVAVFALMYAYWYKFGKEPAGRGTVIAQYEEPEGHPPGLLAAILDQELSQKAVTATLLDLARRGYMKIKVVGDPASKGWFAKKATYEFVKLKDPVSGMQEYERVLFDELFKGSDTTSIEDKKDGSFWKAVQTARHDAFQYLSANGYFHRNPTAVRATWTAVAIIVGIAGFMLSGYFGVLFIVSGILSALIIAGFGWNMPQKTHKGAVLAEEAEGFKLFLSVTERDRLNFTDAPEKNPEQFARFLPAAVAFGVEEKWGKQFADMMVDPPSYIEGAARGWTAGQYVGLVDSMHAVSASGMYHSPSSAGSGGSGFSGGGSGGGMGGGGGGSW